MAVLVDNIMDMTRGRLGKGIALSTTRKGLEPVLRHAVEELQLAHPGRMIEVAIELAHPVEADPDKMARLLSNLLKNALLYGADSTPVNVFCRHGRRQPDAVGEQQGRAHPARNAKAIVRAIHARCGTGSTRSGARALHRG